MNKLSRDKRILIIRCLVEGMSVRSTARTAEVSKGTVIRLLTLAGKVCGEYQAEALHDLPCTRIQVDEIWSFIYAKQKNGKLPSPRRRKLATCGPGRPFALTPSSYHRGA